MFEATDYQWLASSEAQSHWQRICEEPPSDPHALLKLLRRSLDVHRAALLAEQFQLMASSKSKFSTPSHWFWTKQLLEQSSDEQTACETARDFPGSARVLDVCCGAGADSIAMARQGMHVTAIDQNPIACELVRCNARSHDLSVQIELRGAEDIEPSSSDYIHVDPDRRADGHRTTSLERLSPAWSTIEGWLTRCKGLSLKLAPATRLDTHSPEASSSPHAIRFLSKGGSVRQQRWYWNIPRWPESSFTASIALNQASSLRWQAFDSRSRAEPSRAFESEGWFHETFLADDIPEDEFAWIENEVDKRYVGDCDPCIRAASLGPALVRRYGWRLLGTASGYLLSEEPSVHPMVRWFELIECLPADKKQIKACARRLSPRDWELKSRGIDIDLISLRKQLPVSGDSDQRLTILFTKVHHKHVALVCREV